MPITEEQYIEKPILKYRVEIAISKYIFGESSGKWNYKAVVHSIT